ncbi:hypothetical protein MCERH10_01297 [Caulobacteraceae bacterium]
MSALTIRLPSDQHERLKTLAAHLKLSMNKLVGELANQAVTEFDIELRFRARAARGNPSTGLDLLYKLDTSLTPCPKSGVHLKTELTRIRSLG